MVKKETPEDMRERLRQEELKRTPLGSMGEGENRNLADLVGGIGWKGTGLLILLLIAGYIIYSLFF
ncbi:DUF6366 family protein [Bacillus sp. SCS-153A]|uniref:DUF6366 family protein n=1 Tax=Rossellomorea sedimentorum TaxID=3115294 RepID=UPI0039059BF4